jgi:hypothetical protein
MYPLSCTGVSLKKPFTLRALAWNIQENPVKIPAWLAFAAKNKNKEC